MTRTTTLAALLALLAAPALADDAEAYDAPLAADASDEDRMGRCAGLMYLLRDPERADPDPDAIDTAFLRFRHHARNKATRAGADRYYETDDAIWAADRETCLAAVPDW